jgi:hypothetical protein
MVDGVKIPARVGPPQEGGDLQVRKAGMMMMMMDGIQSKVADGVSPLVMGKGHLVVGDRVLVKDLPVGGVEVARKVKGTKVVVVVVGGKKRDGNQGMGATRPQARDGEMVGVKEAAEVDGVLPSHLLLMVPAGVHHNLHPGLPTMAGADNNKVAATDLLVGDNSNKAGVNRVPVATKDGTVAVAVRVTRQDRLIKAGDNNSLRPITALQPTNNSNKDGARIRTITTMVGVNQTATVHHHHLPLQPKDGTKIITTKEGTTPPPPVGKGGTIVVEPPLLPLMNPLRPLMGPLPPTDLLQHRTVPLRLPPGLQTIIIITPTKDGTTTITTMGDHPQEDRGLQVGVSTERVGMDGMGRALKGSPTTPPLNFRAGRLPFHPRLLVLVNPPVATIKRAGR